jgi:hypothetical protein
LGIPEKQRWTIVAIAIAIKLLPVVFLVSQWMKSNTSKILDFLVIIYSKNKIPFLKEM